MRTRPNLLLIMSDQHTQKVTGCYGDRVIETPNLDRLAARGVTFDNAYCPSPICTPTRMSFLTARHPHRQDCWTNSDYLASDIPTIAHSLGAAGLSPTLIGRLHALGPDQLHGYVRREVGDHSPNWIGIPRHDMGVLSNTNEPERASLRLSGAGQMVYELHDEDVTAAAVAHLGRLGEQRRGGDTAPFAMTVGYMLPHAPFVARPEDYARYAGRVGLPGLPAPEAGAEHPWLNWWRECRDILDVPEAEVLRARVAYYALVHSLDRMIGQVLAALEANGLADDTLVVYTSDHGDQLGERGLWWKHTFYDESVKVPLILSWPGRLPEGERRSQLVSLVDLTQTMLDATGAPLLPNADGVSFLDVARDGTTPWTDEVVSEHCTDDTPSWTGGMAVQQRMIRHGRWKLVYYHGYRPQLFDLEADPRELNDLAGDPRHAALRERLVQAVLRGWDPDAIARTMARRRDDKALLGAWAQGVRPDSTYMWRFTPDQNRLEAAD